MHFRQFLVLVTSWLWWIRISPHCHSIFEITTIVLGANEIRNFETKVCPSLEDKKALQIMEETLKMVDGHFQVALPWRDNPPYLPNNRIMAGRRGLLLKKRLLRDGDLRRKYQTTLNEYLEKGYAERVGRISHDETSLWGYVLT